MAFYKLYMALIFKVLLWILSVVCHGTVWLVVMLLDFVTARIGTVLFHVLRSLPRIALFKLSIALFGLSVVIGVSKCLMDAIVADLNTINWKAFIPAAVCVGVITALSFVLLKKKHSSESIKLSSSCFFMTCIVSTLVVFSMALLLLLLKCLIDAIFTTIWSVIYLCVLLGVGAFLSAHSGSSMNTDNHPKSSKATKRKVPMLKSGVKDGPVSLGSDERKAGSGSSVINAALDRPATNSSPSTDETSESKVFDCTGHIHQDSPDAYICSDFLLENCQKGRICSGHHCSRPFLWQYIKLSNARKWKSFSEKDNDTLEKLFCDPTQDESEVKGLKLGTDRIGVISVVCLDNLDMFTWDGFPPNKLSLRRMSTESYLTNPSNPQATKWTWYWQDEYGCWRKYGNDQEGRDLQQLLEEALLNKQTSPYTEFTISAQVYKLDIHSTPMLQKNLRYGTTRPVRRRPLTFISEEDVQQLKRNRGISSGQKQPEKSGNLPSHWSSMSRDVQYIREKLSPSSVEFKDVETLFKKTMKERTSVVSIERVQNPFMWEKYCRKKENMAAVKRRDSNERRLFHGTSPEAVVAICKQNFDWRLHGKNATVYGEGSYFAANASYSHSYAKRDVYSFQYMLLANVLVGSYTNGHSDLRRPPAIPPPNPENDLYDSCVDNISNPTIFVVFDTDQFYPAYVIKYSAESHAYSAVPSYSLGATGYSSASRYQSSSATYVPFQSSHATHGSSNSRSGRQVYSPQYQTSSGQSGYAGSSSSSRDVLRSLNAQLGGSSSPSSQKSEQCSII